MNDEPRAVDANEVLQAARDFFEAEAKMHAAMAACEVSAGYHCRYEIDEASKRGSIFSDVLTAFIDQRVRAALDAAKEQG